MLNIAICDDEKYICDFLKKSVTDCLAKEDLEGSITVFDDGQPLADLYKEGKASFDIILLDITIFISYFQTHFATLKNTIFLHILRSYKNNLSMFLRM